MSDAFESPDWVVAAFAQARAIAERTNAFWLEHLGDPGLFGGFHVEPEGDDREMLFISTLYGGRSVKGTAVEIESCSREYVLSRRCGRAKEAA